MGPKVPRLREKEQPHAAAGLGDVLGCEDKPSADIVAAVPVADDHVLELADGGGRPCADGEDEAAHAHEAPVCLGHEETMAGRCDNAGDGRGQPGMLRGSDRMVLHDLVEQRHDGRNVCLGS
jgi:hypothetical protein